MSLKFVKFAVSKFLTLLSFILFIFHVMTELTQGREFMAISKIFLVIAYNDRRCCRQNILEKWENIVKIVMIVLTPMVVVFVGLSFAFKRTLIEDMLTSVFPGTRNWSEDMSPGVLHGFFAIQAFLELWFFRHHLLRFDISLRLFVQVKTNCGNHQDLTAWIYKELVRVSSCSCATQMKRASTVSTFSDSEGISFGLGSVSSSDKTSVGTEETMGSLSRLGPCLYHISSDDHEAEMVDFFEEMAVRVRTLRKEVHHTSTLFGRHLMIILIASMFLIFAAFSTATCEANAFVRVCNTLLPLPCICIVLCYLLTMVKVWERSQVICRAVSSTIHAHPKWISRSVNFLKSSEIAYTMFSVTVTSKLVTQTLASLGSIFFFAILRSSCW
eukprot:TRINITY_DN54059_c0_g2_i1.p1 TRINITY_DN54059_c0_g2~~TRINITY_DN54059_c0_g2_i1.p1  ORF type:complete len:404 (-),score=42.10 TRINITY_DN54059_c0_g2_i1:316-1470(-)